MASSWFLTRNMCHFVTCLLLPLTILRQDAYSLPTGHADDAASARKSQMRDYMPRGISSDTTSSFSKLPPSHNSKKRKMNLNEVPKYMMHLYEKIADPETGESRIRLYNNSAEENPDTFISSFLTSKARFRVGRIILNFYLSTQEATSRPAATYAELVLYKRRSQLIRNTGKVAVEVVAEVGEQKQEITLTTKQIDLSDTRDDFTIFDVSKLIPFLSKSAETPVKFILRSTDTDVQSELKLIDYFKIHSSKNTRKPLLVTYHGVSEIDQLKRALQEQPHRAVSSRSKRAMGPTKAKRSFAARSDSCRRHSMKIDFSEINWDDRIIAPHGYQAYVCKGKCTYPLSANLNPTNHSTLQALLKALSKKKDIPDVCCTPSKMEPLSILFAGYDSKKENNVELRLWQNMIVAECACR